MSYLPYPWPAGTRSSYHTAHHTAHRATSGLLLPPSLSRAGVTLLVSIRDVNHPTASATINPTTKAAARPDPVDTVVHFLTLAYHILVAAFLHPFLSIRPHQLCRLLAAMPPAAVAPANGLLTSPSKQTATMQLTPAKTPKANKATPPTPSPQQPNKYHPPPHDPPPPPPPPHCSRPLH